MFALSPKSFAFRVQPAKILLRQITQIFTGEISATSWCPRSQTDHQSPFRVSFEQFFYNSPFSCTARSGKSYDADILSSVSSGKSPGPIQPKHKTSEYY